MKKSIYILTQTCHPRLKCNILKQKGYNRFIVYLIYYLCRTNTFIEADIMKSVIQNFILKCAETNETRHLKSGKEQIWVTECYCKEICYIYNITFSGFGGDDLWEWPCQQHILAQIKQLAILKVQPSNQFESFRPDVNKFYWPSIGQNLGINMTATCLEVSEEMSKMWKVGLRPIMSRSMEVAPPKPYFTNYTMWPMFVQTLVVMPVATSEKTRSQNDAWKQACD